MTTARASHIPRPTESRLHAEARAFPPWETGVRSSAASHLHPEDPHSARPVVLAPLNGQPGCGDRESAEYIGFFHEIAALIYEACKVSLISPVALSN